MATSRGRPGHNLLLTENIAEEGVWLLDAEGQHAKPVQLLLQRSRNLRHFFVDGYGQLRMVELLGHSSPYPLLWCTIDSATGHVVSSEQKHMWDFSFLELKIIHHGEVQRLLTMMTPYTFVIVGADTLNEVCRCVIRPCQPNHPDKRIHKIVWSADGTMLAVSMRWLDRSEWPSASRSSRWFEVLIFDTLSGQCLQTAALPAEDVCICWSPQPCLLSVYSFTDREASLHDRGTYRCHKNTIRVLIPAHSKIVLASEDPAAMQEASWEDCYWSPGGELLVAKYNRAPLCDVGTDEGCCILDPLTLKHLFDAQGVHEHFISWASRVHQGTRTLTAYCSHSAIAVSNSGRNMGNGLQTKFRCIKQGHGLLDASSQMAVPS